MWFYYITDWKFKMRDLNDRFVMVPTVLLEIPTFVRHFDSKSIGSVYRVLCSKIWRKPSDGLRKNPSKRTEILASLYETGALASMYDLKTLASAMSYTERNVRRDLSRLEDLNLLRSVKVDGEVFFIVGESNLRANGDRFMGHSSEALYLDSWKDFLNFINQYSPHSIKFFEEDLDKFFTKNGQKFHKFVTKISQNATLEGFRSIVRDMDTPQEEVLLIEKVIEKVIKPLAEGSNEVLENPLKTNVPNRELSEIKNPSDALKYARNRLRGEEITKTEFSNFLKGYVSEELSHYSATPVFAIELNCQKSSKKEESYRLAKLWSALREDLNSSVQPKEGVSEFGKILGNFKSMLKKYSFNQIYWTLTTTVSSSVEDSKFLTLSVGAFEHQVRKLANDYQSLRDASLRKIKSRDSIAMQKSESEEAIEDDANVGYEYTGRLLDVLMGWDSKHE
jgi:DNA-binding transcriptional ArsR family regulator